PFDRVTVRGDAEDDAFTAHGESFRESLRDASVRLQTRLDRLDDAGTHLRGPDDGVDRADPHRAVDVVDPVELRGHLAELLRPDRRAQLLQLGGQHGALRARGGGDARLQLPDPRVRGGAGVDLAG